MLSIMVEGESLLNDGVAILLYEVFKEFVEEPEGSDDQELRLVALFIRITIGGPAFGFFMAKLSCLFLSRIFNDAATEITITLVTAYLTYFIAEHFLGNLESIFFASNQICVHFVQKLAYKRHIF